MKEKWEELYSKEQLKLIQCHLIDILKVFIKVCDELNIEYVVYGGTLLGCAKYGGIIPWDDDIDVALTRENYYRFLREAPSVLPPEYVIQSPYNEKRTPYPYTKLRKKGTVFIEKYYNNLNIEKGIYIDIYPIDNIPDDDAKRKKQFVQVRRRILHYYFRQCIHVERPFIKGKFLSSIAQIFLYYFFRLFPHSFFVRRIDKAMSKYNKYNTRRKACLFSPKYDNIYLQLYPLKVMKFGDIDVMVPYCYKDHLRKRYGDYEKDLPNEKRFGHVPYEIQV